MLSVPALLSQDAVAQDSPRPAADNHIDFAHDILPLLKARCAECHTNGTYKAALSLETRAALLDSGTVEPGDSEGSYLIERIASTDPEERMPPEGEPLTKQQIAVLTAWIDQGAKWPEEISLKEPKYIAPLAPRTPELPAAVAGREHPIDRIVDA
ncbi:MAG: c-type cytochrome domain-containing protein, partial [Pirellulales bacterium]